MAAIPLRSIAVVEPDMQVEREHTLRVKTNNACVPCCVIETDRAKRIISQIRTE